MLEHCVLAPGTTDNVRAHALRAKLEKALQRVKPAKRAPARTPRMPKNAS